MNKITFEVPNINCNHCINTIQTELGDLAGVSSVSASSDNKNVEIEFTDPATKEILLDKLEQINYPAAA